VNVPRLLVLTDRAQAGRRDLASVVAGAVAGGARAVVLREKDLPDEPRRRLVDELLALLDPVGGLLLSASSCEDGAAGVHLSADDPYPAAPPPIVGRSCHRGPDLVRAAREGCTYATLSPIFPSDSKPGYGPPLGVGALAGSPLPVVALGGVTAANAAACLDAGAAGVAVMGAVMRAPDPAAAVATILDRLAAVAEP
jgi:thiamine-phosphate pyrophosphorylase